MTSLKEILKNRFWRFLVSHPWDWLMSEYGYLSSLEEHGFLTISPYTDEMRETNYGSTRRLLNSVEARAPQYPFPSLPSEEGFYRSFLARNNLPPTEMMYRF